MVKHRCTLRTELPNILILLHFYSFLLYTELVDVRNVDRV